MVYPLQDVLGLLGPTPGRQIRLKEPVSARFADLPDRYADLPGRGHSPEPYPPHGDILLPTLGLCSGERPVIRYRITPTHCVSFSHPEGEAAMAMLARAGCIALASLCLLAGDAAAQPAKPGCVVRANGAGNTDAALRDVDHDRVRERRQIRAQGSQPRRPDQFRRTQQQGATARGAKETGPCPVRGGDAAGDCRGARHQMGRGRRRWKDFRVCRRRPCQRRARSAAAAGSISGPATASMSRRQANWSSSAGRPRASRP